MRIGIHAVAAANPERTGVGEYTYQLLRAWAADPPPGHTFFVYSHAPLDFDLPPSFVFRRLRSPFLWTQGRLPFALWRDRPDVMFFPSQFPPLFAPGRVAITIHGCEFRDFPRHYQTLHRFYLDRLTAWSLTRAHTVITVSRATAERLAVHYGFDPARAIVIHHGVSAPSQISSNLHAGVRQPFFLFLGRVGFKKNVDGLIRAFTVAKQQYRIPHQLVIAGPAGRDTADITAFARTTLRPQCQRPASLLRHDRGRIETGGDSFAAAPDDMLFTGYVTEPEKWSLLAAADALVFPSHAEGFGIPLIEAHAVGTPVIASDIPAFREIAESGVRWVNAGDGADLAAALVEVARDPQLCASLAEGSRRNAHRFSWKKTAAQTLRVITEVAGE